MSDITTDGVIYAVSEASVPLGWILGTIYFVGNEIYKSNHHGRSITEDLFDN